MPVQPIGVEKRKGTYGSPYSIRDFRAINPDYGTPDDLRRLVGEAHARGLRVILDVVAKLDYANPKTRAAVIETLVYWLSEYAVDGFRCDVAGLVPTDLWEEAREKLGAVRPGLFLLAEWSAPELSWSGARRSRGSTRR